LPNSISPDKPKTYESDEKNLAENLALLTPKYPDIKAAEPPKSPAEAFVYDYHKEKAIKELSDLLRLKSTEYAQALLSVVKKRFYNRLNH